MPENRRKPLADRSVSAARRSQTTARVRALRIQAAAGHVVCSSSCHRSASRSCWSRRGRGSAPTAVTRSSWGAASTNAATRCSRGVKPWISTIVWTGAWTSTVLQASRSVSGMAVITGLGAAWFLVEGGQSRDLLAQDQRVDVVRPLVGVDRFEVCEVPHRLVFGQDAVGAEQPPRLAGHVGGHAHVVALGERDLLRRGLSLVFQEI